MKKNIILTTSQRVSQSVDPQINSEIRNQTIKNLNIFKNCNPTEISDRIRILDQEWDAERVLEVNASLLLLLSSYMGIRLSRIWFLLTGTIAICMMWHVFLGFKPLLTAMRKCGIRTSDEIYNEKIALKVIRGDFKGEYSSVEDALNMVEKK